MKGFQVKTSTRPNISGTLSSCKQHGGGYVYICVYFCPSFLRGSPSMLGIVRHLIACLSCIHTSCRRLLESLVIQVGIRPDRRARGMLHISGGGSEWGVGQSGRGRWNVPPTWGNAGRGNVKNGGILGAGGHPRHPWRHSWRGMLIFHVFFGAF